jgi:hypothetical protein
MNQVFKKRSFLEERFQVGIKFPLPIYSIVFTKFWLIEFVDTPRIAADCMNDSIKRIQRLWVQSDFNSRLFNEKTRYYVLWILNNINKRGGLIEAMFTRALAELARLQPRSKLIQSVCHGMRASFCDNRICGPP